MILIDYKITNFSKFFGNNNYNIGELASTILKEE